MCIGVVEGPSRHKSKRGQGREEKSEILKGKIKLTKFLNIKKQDLKAAILLRKTIHSRYKGQGELSLIYKNSRVNTGSVLAEKSQIPQRKEDESHANKHRKFQNV